MLTANIQFTGTYDLDSIFQSLGLLKQGSQYVLITPDRKELAKISQLDSKLEFSFPPNLSMEEYAQIHRVLVQIHEKIGGTIEDSNSLLGYLQNGEEARIVTNWEAWVAFLQGARHKTMQGQKVRIIDEKGMEIGTGLLLDYETNDKSGSPFSVSSCTLVTSFGERRFTGQNLKIEPTGEW